MGEQTPGDDGRSRELPDEVLAELEGLISDINEDRDVTSHQKKSGRNKSAFSSRISEPVEVEDSDADTDQIDGSDGCVEGSEIDGDEIEADVEEPEDHLDLDDGSDGCVEGSEIDGDEIEADVEELEDHFDLDDGSDGSDGCVEGSEIDGDEIEADVEEPEDHFNQVDEASGGLGGLDRQQLMELSRADWPFVLAGLFILVGLVLIVSVLILG